MGLVGPLILVEIALAVTVMINERPDEINVRKKMDFRVTWRPYFDRVDDTNYARLGVAGMPRPGRVA